MGGLQKKLTKGFQTKKSLLVVDEANDVKPGVRRTYTSRRSVAFDDYDSAGEEDARKISGVISYKDT